MPRGVTRGQTVPALVCRKNVVSDDRQVGHRGPVANHEQAIVQVPLGNSQNVIEPFAQYLHRKHSPERAAAAPVDSSGSRVTNGPHCPGGHACLSLAWPVWRRRRSRARARSGRLSLGERFACTILSRKGGPPWQHRERMRAYRERARRGLRRFTISVSADDLSVIAEHGYEGAASTDQDCRSQAISRFISDTVACLDRTG